MAKINPEEFEEQTIISVKNLGENYKNWPMTPPITLHWECLNAYTKEPRNLFKKFRKRNQPAKHLIKYVNGIAKPGSLLAIMGASGAGKTTLLNLLNMRNHGSLRVTGEVKINGLPISTPEELSSISAYVQQEDMFIGYLKVKEQLRFQAFLKMNRNDSVSEKESRVEQILNELNLKKVENSFIGDPERGVKGISGGERRRLSVGCELITNPSLVFFDEPTSGLDSYMATSIVDEMKQLAKRGKTIICTIHQPSSLIFAKFDRLCLLTEGRLAFFGDREGANYFFQSQGYPVPSNFNPADHYINILASMNSSKNDLRDLTLNKITENFQVSDLNTKLNYELKTANEKAEDPYFFLNLSKKTSYKANCFNQLKWLLWRAGLSTIRDPLETTVSIIQTIVISIILGLIFLRLKYDQPGIQNINGVLFLLIANTSFTYIIVVINTFTLEIPLFLRENKNGMYTVLNYYTAKTLIDLPKFIILPLCLTTIVYWMTNLNNDFERYVICCVIIVMVAHTSVAFGAFLSAISPSVNVALNLTGPLLPPLMIFSGFFLNNSTTPSYFIWLKYLSWFNYSNELLNINQWKGVTNITCTDSRDLCLSNGSEILEKLDMKLDNYSIDFVAIMLLLLGYRLLTFFALLFKSYRK